MRAETHIAAEAKPTIGICGNCGRSSAPHGLEKWGASLELRYPPFVRICSAETGPLGVQLVNAWWSCKNFEGARA